MITRTYHSDNSVIRVSAQSTDMIHCSDSDSVHLQVTSVGARSIVARMYWYVMHCVTVNRVKCAF